MAKISMWFMALRPASLLISLMTVMVGNALAYQSGAFNPLFLVLTLLITCFLQLVSNLSNDLGDYLKGTDISEQRLGPSRHLEREELNPTQIKRAIFIVLIGCVMVGSILLYEIYHLVGWFPFVLFFGIGIGAIIAAIKYTLGKNPYGYYGLGDLFAFLFFGPIGVIGIYFLHCGVIGFDPILPAIAVGLLTTSILNLNNIRDIDNDQQSGKITIAVRLGHQKARLYHLLINVSAMMALVIYSHWANINGFHLSYLIAMIPLLAIALIIQSKPSHQLQPFFEATVIFNFILTLAFSLALIWH